MSYFISRTTRVYSWAVNHRISTLYALTAMVLLGGGALWYFGCYCLVEQRIERYKAEQQSLEKNCIFVERNKPSHKQVQESLSSMLNELRTLGVEHAHAGRATLIDKLASSGMLLNTLTTDQEQAQEWCVSQKLSFDAHGSLSQIFKWFEQSAQLPLLLSVEHLVLSRVDEKNWHIKCDLDYSCLKNDIETPIKK